LKTRTQDELLQEILSKLDIVVAFLAARGLESDPSAVVERLAALGFGSKVIAPVAGLTENAVAIRLTRMKKKVPTKNQKLPSDKAPLP
jgi:hypothetical protein